MGRDTRETAAWTRAEKEVSKVNQKMLLKTSLMERVERGGRRTLEPFLM